MDQQSDLRCYVPIVRNIEQVLQLPPAVDIDELCRMAAQQILATALLAERQAYLDGHACQVDTPPE